MGEVEFGDILRALLLTQLLTIVLWFMFGLVFKNRKLGALLGWVTVGLFFTYQAQNDHLWNMLPSGGLPLNILLPIFVWVGACLMAYYFKNSLEQTTKILNIACWCLLGVQLASFLGIQMMGLQVSTTESHASVHEAHDPTFTQTIPSDESNVIDVHEVYPNIYYILLDGYGRDDVLKEMYDYDNAPFLQNLEKNGFYIARKSRSNYAQTVLSLSSSLNFQYLDELTEKIGKDSGNRSLLRTLIHENELMSFLKSRGYQTLAFSSGISFTEMRGADRYIVPDGTLTEWESFFLMRTPFPTVVEEIFGYSIYDVHKNRLTQIVHQLPMLEIPESPQFVFAHFVAPHPPFVLGKQDRLWQKRHAFAFRDGSRYRYHYKISSHEYIVRYREQLDVLNGMIEEAIHGILSDSERPSVIIVQSDHGPGAYLDWQDPKRTVMKERMSILNAYYIPNEENIGLYEDISPVNSFRLILNRYFDMSLPLLEDESYFSTMSRPYDFIRVTEMIEEEDWGEKAQFFQNLTYQ